MTDWERNIYHNKPKIRTLRAVFLDSCGYSILINNSLVKATEEGTRAEAAMKGTDAAVYDKGGKGTGLAVVTMTQP
jgi:hypothetical protein